jgi:hypothetical protein
LPHPSQYQDRITTVPNRPPRSIVCLLALVCLALAPGAARAQRVYDPLTTPRAKFVAPLAPYPNASYRAKDFSIIKKGDWYHLFYTRVRRFSPRHYEGGGTRILNEVTFGHAMSRDLENWFPLDSVLTIHPGSWDAHHVWAPDVVEKNGVYWLFYTGVVDAQLSASPTDWVPRTQTIGAAYSTDANLQTWTRVAAPVWAPCAGNGLPGVPWALCSTGIPDGSNDFRDPFVLPPPYGSPPGTPWLMYYSARPNYDPYNYVVGVAQSAVGPGGSWSDVGAVWDTYTPTSNSQLESPTVFERNGVWHMFTTGDAGLYGILWNISLVPSSGKWEVKGPITPMLAGKQDVPYPYTLEPQFWFASEHFAEAGPVHRADYFCVVHAYDAPAQYNAPTGPGEDISIIEFREMLWHPDGSFDLVAPNPVRSLGASTSQPKVGDTIQLTLGVEGGRGRWADLQVVKVVGQQQTPVGPTAVGLPASVALSDGPVTVDWPVQSGGLGLPVTLEVRVASQPMKVSTRVTLQEGIIINGPGSGGTPITDGPDPGARSLSLREIGSTPLGGGRALLVEMPAAGRARIELFDVLGRKVRNLSDRELPRGSTIETWDGRDDAGRTAQRGIYFARVTTRFGLARARLLVL